MAEEKQTDDFKMAPYQRHIFVCVGDQCAPAGQGAEVYEYLKERLRVLGLQDGARRVCRSKTTCLGVCRRGPVAVVYPEGVWYSELDVLKMESIVQEHLKEGRAVGRYFLQDEKAMNQGEGS